MSDTRPQRTRSVRHYLLVGIEVLASVVLCVMMLHVVANALSRTLWREPIFGSLEVTQYYYVPILALLGLVAAQARDEHIVADLLFDSFPPAARKFTTVAVNAISGLVTALISYFAFAKFQHALDRSVTAGNTEIPLWPIHLFMAILYAVFTIQMLFLAYLTARGTASTPTHETEVDEAIAELDSAGAAPVVDDSTAKEARA